MQQFDYSRLKGKIKEKFNTQNDFAKAMDMTPTTLSAKLKNRSYFSSNEISRAVDLLNIRNSIEGWNIFFTKQVDKKSTE